MSKTIYAKSIQFTQVKIFWERDTEALEKKVNDFFYVLDQLHDFRDPSNQERFTWTLLDLKLSESQTVGNRFGEIVSNPGYTAMAVIRANYRLDQVKEILEVLAMKIGGDKE